MKMKERIQAKRARSPLDRRLRRAWWWRVDAPGGGHFLQRGPLPQLTQVTLMRLRWVDTALQADPAPFCSVKNSKAP